ncbi:MAG TPA: nuclease-related domain-containing protein, partial [Caldimonas sp.]|nr:nuclease-related domain-containing protein [Caldimonas sp.]
PYRDRGSDITVLTSLAARRDCTSRTRSDIDTELRKIRAGQKGEKDAAYAIDFFLAQRDEWAVIHDLRIEWQGRVAQIDHLFINRLMDVWVCESKHFSEGVSINEHGEFTAFYNNRPRGIESPIEQNQRHIKVLESVLGSSILPLPTRLGIPLRSTIRSVVLVSAAARITRPKQTFEGLETVIKADQLRSRINQAIDAMGVGETLLKATKMVGTETLRQFASDLGKLHRPQQFDWAARFGMSAHEPMAVRASAAPVRQTQTRTQVAAEPAGAAKISSSKLASLLGLPSARALLERLVAEGFLVPTHQGHALTEAGLAAGGEFVEKSRYGPYFVWPPALQLRERQT